MDEKGMRWRAGRRKQKLSVRRQRCVEQPHDKVEKINGGSELMMDPACAAPECEGVGDVVGVEAPLGGVAQVIFHGVQVVEVGVQVRVHQDRGVEEDGEGQVEVEREVGEDQGERHMCNMA